MSRDFLMVSDFTSEELARCLRLAGRCKRTPTLGHSACAGKTLAMVFQKPSLRTRVSFEVAARQLGGSSLYLGPHEVQLGTREPIKDVARTLSRYVDGLVIRSFRHQDVEEFAQYASVPVINGLSDLHHPCQALADLLTVQERFGRLRGVSLSYLGDGNNVLHSLAQAASALGVHLRVATPSRYRPQPAIWDQAVRQAKRHGATLSWGNDPKAAVRKADVIYTDVWASMGDEHEHGIRRKAFRGFQLTGDLLRLARPRCIVMHCLPAHRGEEIATEVLDGPRSVVFEQAENRLHAQKALLMLLFGGAKR